MLFGVLGIFGKSPRNFFLTDIFRYPSTQLVAPSTWRINDYNLEASLTCSKNFRRCPIELFKDSFNSERNCFVGREESFCLLQRRTMKNYIKFEYPRAFMSEQSDVFADVNVTSSEYLLTRKKSLNFIEGINRGSLIFHLTWVTDFKTEALAEICQLRHWIFYVIQKVNFHSPSFSGRARR